MRKKGIKVKRRRKNFYKKRKSTGRKVLEAILVILLVVALVFVGYSVAAPLIKFFSGNGDNSEPSEPAWTPPPATTTTQSGTDAETTTTPPTTTEVPEEKPHLLDNATAVTAPDTALASIEALKQYLETAKSGGYKTVVFSLKDDTGHLLYKSDVKLIKNNTTINTGALAAKDIVKVCKDAEITPVASIYALNDHLISKFVMGAGYRTTDDWEWLDAAYDKGGKPWATPYSEDTVNYLSDITKELSSSGFESIVLRDVTFPHFVNYDYSLLPEYLQEDARTEKLTALINKCVASATKSHSYVNIDAEKLLTLNTAFYPGSAEIWKQKDSLSASGIVITIDVNTIGKTLQISDSESLKVETDIAKA
ncbi:MAG: hypothetical protein IKT78_05270, partial [Ruminiclostridium sp.]|nr:hypothetical protein [Ruminiclostridium sp.]